jgi:hypothetical protein
MEIKDRTDLEPAFREVEQSNPLVAIAMKHYRLTGDLSEREALMYVVIALAGQNKELEQMAIKAHLLAPRDFSTYAKSEAP